MGENTIKLAVRGHARPVGETSVPSGGQLTGRVGSPHVELDRSKWLFGPVAM